MTKNLLSLALAATLATSAAGAPAASAAPAAAGSFADNPIVYFVVTDRFANGNPANDQSYGRQKDGKKEIGTWHGGDFAGLTAKLKAGWFKALGVNAIWITPPFEQIHGWVVGGNKEFEHYAYHGYYALDYTRLDANLGTDDELRELVDTAHAQGIRVLFDVVLNHPGYGDLKTLAEYQVGVLWEADAWKKSGLQNYHSFIDYNSTKWVDWWGPDWIRAGLRGYAEGNRDDLTGQLAYLPDFKTESTKPVGLPNFYKHKADTRAKPIEGATVRQYLVTWLTQWVRDYGIDGFRADTVKHVEPAAWDALKQAGTAALAEWKAKNPGKKIDDAPFWMTGEYWGHGPDRGKLFDAGFDNMINFDFQDRAEKAVTPTLKPAELDKLYTEYAKVLGAPAKHNVLSYLSSHDTALFDRTRLIDGASALLLAPGGVQIYYGDETARPAGPFTPGDKQQQTRSDMNWQAPDAALLEHWKKLGQFRSRHVALARGAHAKLADAPYTFSRVVANGATNDRVVVALGMKTPGAVNVAGVFNDGAKLRDAYSGAAATVAAGKVEITPAAHGVVLLEEVQ